MLKAKNAQQKFEVEMPERQVEKRDAAALPLTLRLGDGGIFEKRLPPTAAQN